LRNPTGAATRKLAPLGFRAPRFHRALPQEIELVFIQTAFQSQQEAIVAEPRAIDRFQVDQDRVDHATDLDQVLPLATIPCKSRHLTRSHPADIPETNLGHHAFEAGARDRPCGGPTQVFIHNVDLAPA
jgi:hypothetical protein